MIRAHALGNFRALLGGVARSIAMLRYLDNHVSQDSGPNENYARELLELHTLGAENYLGIRDPATVPRDSAGLATGYVDNDVYEVARCFTGWTYDMDASWLQMTNTGAFVYRKDWHDRFNKMVLGRYIKPDQPDMKDGQDVLTMLARHPGTAHFVCRKLCRRLIADDPPEGVVSRAAAVFLKNVDTPDQLRQVVRAIVRSPEFRGAYGAKIKRPFESAISMLRALNAQFTDTRPFFWHYDLMGQPIFGRHSPDGHPDTRAAWSNTVSILYRWRFAIHLTEGWVKDDDHSFKVDILAETPTDKRAPDAALRYWAERILLRPLPDAHHTAIVATLKSADDSNYAESLTHAVQLILMSPQAQLR